MAWSDQCKIAFVSNARALVWKKRHKTKKNVSVVLRNLSKESGIPVKTLNRWYYDKENCLKNEVTKQTPENNAENDPKDDPGSPDNPVIPFCGKCKTAHVEVCSRSGSGWPRQQPLFSSHG